MYFNVHMSQYDVIHWIPVTLEGCTSFFDQTGVVRIETVLPLMLDIYILV